MYNLLAPFRRIFIAIKVCKCMQYHCERLLFFYVILSMSWWWDETGKQTIDIKGRLMFIAFQLPRIPITKQDFLELVTFIVASFYRGGCCWHSM